MLTILRRDESIAKSRTITFNVNIIYSHPPAHYRHYDSPCCGLYGNQPFHRHNIQMLLSALLFFFISLLLLFFVCLFVCFAMVMKMGR